MTFCKDLIELMKLHRIKRMTGGVFEPRSDTQMTGACFEFEEAAQTKSTALADNRLQAGPGDPKPCTGCELEFASRLCPKCMTCIRHAVDLLDDNFKQRTASVLGKDKI